MNDQSKTTMVRISVGLWSEATDCPLSQRFAAAHAIAVQIATRCQMDIMSFAPYSLEEQGEECFATVVYVNNGCSLAEVCSRMRPEIDKRTQMYWLIADLTEWQGMLDCTAFVRGTDEQWG
jgi:hypothetical protein